MPVNTPSDDYEKMATGQALKAAKRELRQLIKTRLSSIPTSSLETQSSKIYQSLIIEPFYTRAERISVYLSMPSGEIQTDAIVRHALGEGKEVFVPYLFKNPNEAAASAGEAPQRIMDMVKLKDLKDYEGLERDSWGIPSINSGTVKGRERILESKGRDADELGLDLMLMPGVAFDVEEYTRVRRLGHGRGFYDYFLSRYEQRFGKRQRLPRFGLALEEQFLGRGEELAVPVGEQDHFVDCVLVGDGSIYGCSTPLMP